MLSQQQQDEPWHDPPQPSSLAKCLHVETTTWVRDSHELFDYETQSVQQRSYFMRKAGRVLRSVSEVEVNLDRAQQQQHIVGGRAVDHLVSVRTESTRGAEFPTYVVVPADRASSPPPPSSSLVTKKLWLIVKELQGGKHKLVEGDVIKLGRYKLRVKQLGVSSDVVPDLKWEDSEPLERPVSKEDASTKQCRICLSDGCSGDDDPLVCPCNCRGSIEFVHVECLKRWVRGKLGVPEDAQGPKVATFLRQIFCELCKSPFPSFVTVNGDKIPVVPLPPTDAPFVVLEHIIGVSGQTPPSTRGLHILCLNSRKEVKLGRGHESDVRIADVSISRYHATIRFADAGHFLLEDHQSKFGTLVSLRRNVSVDEVHPLSVQVGRTVMKFRISDPPCEFSELLELRTPQGEERSGGGAPEQVDTAAPQQPPTPEPLPAAFVTPDGAGGGRWIEANGGPQHIRPGVAGSMVSALQEVSAQLSHALLSRFEANHQQPPQPPQQQTQAQGNQGIPSQQQQQQQRFGRGPSL